MLRFSLFLFFVLHFPLSLAAERIQKNSDYIPIQATRLVSDADHTRFLKNTLATATSQVMISTYNVSPDRLFGEGIGQAIIDAAERGVAVYVYYENRPWYSKEDYADLEIVASCCAVFEDNDNHSKCVIKDKGTVAIGSYNWLSDTRNGSSNGSLVVTGGLASGLINDVWQGIRFYQSLAYGNERGIERFLNDQDAFSTGEYQFSPGQFLYTLRTPEAHGLFLDEAFGKAQSRVILFSPFIRLTKLQEVFSNTRLSALQQKGVQIKLVTLPSPCSVPEEQRKIFSTLKNLCIGYPNFSYLTISNFHAKTLLADYDLICEGSFNWLSAVTEIDHEANNFEMSVAIRGNIAREMIQKFEGTTFAQSIIQKPRQPIQAPLLKRDPPVASYTKQPSFQKTKRPQPQEDPSIKQPPFKKLKTGPVNIPPSFNNAIKIFSGERFGIDGYCVRFNNGDYLKNRGDILYFETPEDAKGAAYAIWKK